MKRRSVFLILVLAVAVLAAALGVFLLTFDLDQHRSRIETALGSALNRPVSLGEASFSLRHGPALAFADIRTELTGETSGDLTIERLFLKLEIFPLLRQRLVFSEVVLDRPSLSLVRTTVPPAPDRPEGAVETAPPPAITPLLESALIKTLSWQKGTIRWQDDALSTEAFRVVIENFSGGIKNFSLQNGGDFELSGDLSTAGKTASFAMTGSAGPGFSRQEDWPDCPIRVDLSVNNFDPAPWLDHFGASPPPLQTSGTLSLQLGLNGSWHGGWALTGQLRSPGLLLSHEKLAGPAPAIRKLGFNGKWNPETAHLSLARVLLETAAGTVEGSIETELRNGSRQLSGNLASTGIDLLQTRPVWPEKLLRGPLGRGLQSGSLEVARFIFDGPIAAWQAPPASWPLTAARLHLHGLGLSFAENLTLTDLTADLSWTPGRVEVAGGSGRLLNAPLSFAGNILFPPNSPAEFDLRTEGAWSAERIRSLIPPEKLGKLAVAGSIPFNIDLKGSTARQLIDIQLNLADLELDLPNLIEKPAGQPASFYSALSVTADQVELGHGKLQLGELEIRSQGFLNRDETGDFGLDIDVEKAQVASIDDLLPSLQRLHPEGALSLHYHWEGKEGRLQKQSGKVSLHQMGLHIVGVIADLHQVSGEINIGPDHAEIAGLSARLGESPATVSGRVDNFSDPAIELNVSLPRLRSQDLFFFRSHELTLENVVGRLLIDRRHIEFAPVTLTMERGTRLSVTGKVDNFKAPRVLLNIDADQANLDEVVGLWQGPGRPSPPMAAGNGVRKKRPVTVEINANIRQGTLGGLGSMGDLAFKELEGKIKYREGLLTIYPLHFHSGPGFFVGEVAVDNRQGSPPLFKISGHLDRFDAAALHHDLLRRRGVVTGNLTGDFYLQGFLGGRFAETSLGGFDLEVREGVLRKFKFLSKVFSLLNVSQILTLQLPDMALEGMPFEQLKATFSLREGLLATEDLFVESNAMNLSLVGDFNVVDGTLDAVLGVKPLRTVDRIITKIPIAGWILTGEEKAIVTAHFQIRGPADDPDVVPLPINSLSGKVLGIFQRVLGLPGKMVTDLGNLAGGAEEDETQKQGPQEEKEIAPANP